MIRVTRLLIYEYATPERAAADMAKWHMAANGSKDAGPDLMIHSAIITELNAKVVEDDTLH